MKKILITLLFAMSFMAPFAQTNDLERVSPESEGIHSEDIIKLFDSMTNLPNVDLHSLVIMRHGKVVGEVYPAPFKAEYKHTMYSCSKTFVSAAIGIAIDENRLRLDDRVAPFFANELPKSITKELADITVRDLLTMTSGITPDWNMRNIRKDWVKGYLGKSVITPGSKFMYDSLCTYLLSAIVQKVSGKTLLDYLKPRLFEPMNIWDVQWEISPDGYNTGGWGLLIQSESLGKFGQLLLNKGEWGGRQLISEEWVNQMMTKQMEAGDEDYGYQIWMCDYPGAWRADGAYGQYVIVVPQKEMVIVVTQCSSMNGRKERNIIWRTLLDKVTDTPIKEGKDYNKLLKKQTEYAFPTVKGKSDSWKASAINGKTIELSKNKLGWKSIKFSFKKEELTAEITDVMGKISTIAAGHENWTTSSLGNYPPYSITAIGRYKGLTGPFHAASSYGWNNKGSDLTMQIHYVDWISALRINFNFQQVGKVTMTVKANYEGKPFTITGTF